MAAEWTKLWSVRSTWWSLLATAGLMLLAAPIIGSTMVNNRRGGPLVSATEVTISTVYIAQFGLIALAMLAITAEYTSGSIRTTLQAVPRRGTLLLAKTLVVGAVCLVAGTATGLLGIAAASLMLGDLTTVDSGEAVATALRIGVHLALISALTVGVAVAVRSAAGTLTIVFVGLTMVSLILSATDMAPLEYVADRLPDAAGTHFMNADGTPYGPMTALLFVVGWAVLVQAVGYLVLRKRDA
ncbi:ABC transporter permease subunit [Streptomyces asiaticus]|uniref:ABC transporter permease subunit n=3 Tax=Streptomyces TaxID=1883 RepID=A0ABP3ZVV7_9ACTN